ncbi:MAG: DUF2269 domain-containing protein [Sulfurovum sp.]
MSYNTLIFIHIVSVILLLGVGGGSAFYKFMADRSKNLEVIVHTNKMVVLADWLFTTPSAILQPLTGIMLINLMGIPWNTPWLLISLILYTFAGVLWLIALYLQIRMKYMALLAYREKKILGREYFKLVNYWIWLGVFSFFAMIGVFYLMVFKLS